MPDQAPKMPPGRRKQKNAAYDSGKPRATLSGRAGQIEGKLNDTLTGVAVVMSMKGDLYPAEIVQQVGPQWSRAIVELAKENVQLMRLLEKLTTGGTWGVAFATTAALVAPIIAYYGDGKIVSHEIADKVMSAPYQFGFAEPGEDEYMQAIYNSIYRRRGMEPPVREHKNGA